MPLLRIKKQYVVRELVLKVHERCNLACDYCYMYEHADQSWRRKPVTMSNKVINRLAIRIPEYMREHDLPDMSVILHGGETLLAGQEKIEYLITRLRAALTDGQELDFAIQTNGTELDESWLELFLKHNISVGVSLDGTEAVNRHRLYPSGKSSHDKVRDALKLFQQERFRGLLRIILCVVDLENDPTETYDYLAQFCQGTDAQIDFLLPFANWDRPPAKSFAQTGFPHYAHWLLQAYSRWMDTDGPPIRMIDQIMTLAGWEWEHNEPYRGPGQEVIGPFVVGGIVIETDGSYEGPDGLKTVAEGEPELGLNIFKHTLTWALVALLRMYQSRGIADAAPECNECPMFAMCGGGYYPHRYGEGSYTNPSVYCGDLFGLTSIIRRATHRGLDNLVSAEHATP